MKWDVIKLYCTWLSLHRVQIKTVIFAELSFESFQKVCSLITACSFHTILQ